MVTFQTDLSKLNPQSIKSIKQRNIHSFLSLEQFLNLFRKLKLFLKSTVSINVLQIKFQQVHKSLIDYKNYSKKKYVSLDSGLFVSYTNLRCK